MYCPYTLMKDQVVGLFSTYINKYKLCIEIKYITHALNEGNIQIKNILYTEYYYYRRNKFKIINLPLLRVPLNNSQFNAKQ